MSVIYLSHPIHGSKVACTEAEAKYDEINGWLRYTDATQVDSPEVAALEQPVKRPYRRKELAVEGEI